MLCNDSNCLQILRKPRKKHRFTRATGKVNHRYTVCNVPFLPPTTSAQIIKSRGLAQLKHRGGHCNTGGPHRHPRPSLSISVSQSRFIKIITAEEMWREEKKKWNKPPVHILNSISLLVQLDEGIHFQLHCQGYAEETSACIPTWKAHKIYGFHSITKNLEIIKFLYSVPNAFIFHIWTSALLT